MRPSERDFPPGFRYFGPSDAYFDAIINWQKVRNGVEGLTKEEIGYENGVLGGLVSALNAFASHGDGVLVHIKHIRFKRVLKERDIGLYIAG